MGRLVYGSICSLDGYIADEQGEFDWSAPGDEVMAFLNERDGDLSCELYGRRLYEVMKVWQTFGTEPDASTGDRDFGEHWRNRDKVVFSTTLDRVDTVRTTLRPTFDPAWVRRLVDSNEGDVSIGGPGLAGHALRAGLVDRLELYLNPVVIGGGTPWLPGGLSLDLRLTEEHRFSDGVVYLAYDVT